MMRAAAMCTGPDQGGSGRGDRITGFEPFPSVRLGVAELGRRSENLADPDSGGGRELGAWAVGETNEDEDEDEDEDGDEDGDGDVDDSGNSFTSDGRRRNTEIGSEEIGSKKKKKEKTAQVGVCPRQESNLQRPFKTSTAAYRAGVITTIHRGFVRYASRSY
ncbi:hypothetical protein B0H17DRAFT_1182989 [Mycena rosella]|uniref:Uncharacterized protein n=1 Tax=Mycena rosella TaxID=1033263 RepID=A0AAD7D2H1_MYCRO|nr:hypothetical protein B0H17DRAFT_1182989 [Mycena rosella]